ncbi:MAG: hypothetical protein H0T78_07900 [Longispora sp.]|nr:hypothetical protein [Longispora sp. (in: high G+C Gram-positive bacteria)]
MKKWVIALIITLVVLLACCGIGAFLFYGFFQKSTAERSSYEQVQEGQTRSEAEKLMGGNGLPSEYTDNPPAGTDCRFWINRDEAAKAFEICYADGRVVSKSEYDTGS